MNKRKPAGLDGIHPYVLSECASILSIPLSLMFTLSFISGVIPSMWKLANITPIFKKGSKLCAANYRPISLTSVACKTMERLVRDEMLGHLLKQKLLDKSQHGFVFVCKIVRNKPY